MDLDCLQVDWKLTRGKWRPRLLGYAKNASEEAVSDATKLAYTLLETTECPDMQHVQQALKALTSLKAGL